MGNILLLDCTLRDGGYVNDWQFGLDVIKGFSKKIVQTGVEFYEVGFIKGDSYNPDRAVFPDTKSISNVIDKKSDAIKYVGMLDMSAPADIDKLEPASESCLDAMRVIFKKDKIDAAYDYCQKVKDKGYILFANLVGTDDYSEEEFVATVKKFSELEPYGIAIVDSFGLIRRKQFIKYVTLADENIDKNIALCYHAHNNLQQAFGNAESFVELELDRDIVIDACVFGMGRGAGNLNLELFAEYLNENYNGHYNIEPMLEIMDEYLNDIYREKFWGYSLPLYLSANLGCHPNYAIYYAEKDSLTVKAFNELLKSISDKDKRGYSKEKAEHYYRKFLENYIDDKEILEKLEQDLADKDILIIAPGKSVDKYKEKVLSECKDGKVVIALNFLAEEFKPDYIFSSNMRRYMYIQGKTDAKCITTSNMRGVETTDYVVNFASCSSEKDEIIDNSGLMLLRLLNSIGVKRVSIAGMDGYTGNKSNDYCNKELEFDFSSELLERNAAIEKDLRAIARKMEISFVTPTEYKI